MKGCELHGRYAFFNDDKNVRLRQKQARTKDPDQGAEADGSTHVSGLPK
jgi:hypothetical protein